MLIWRHIDQIIKKCHVSHDFDIVVMIRSNMTSNDIKLTLFWLSVLLGKHSHLCKKYELFANYILFLFKKVNNCVYMQIFNFSTFHNNIIHCDQLFIQFPCEIVSTAKPVIPVVNVRCYTILSRSSRARYKCLRISIHDWQWP